MDDTQAVDRIVVLLGGVDNIESLNNCMTRLHLHVRDEGPVDEKGLRDFPKVMALVHDQARRYEVVVGPGTSYAYADLIHQMGVAAAPAEGEGGRPDGEKPAEPGRRALKGALKALGEIFVPLIPGIIAAGLCAGLASLLTQLVPDYQDIGAWNVAWEMLTLVNASFISFITAWAGYRAAERFGATPILGGMLGMVTCLSQINEISKILGLYNENVPLSSILLSGKGGVLAAVFGVLILSAIEKRVHRRMPSALDVVFTPLITLLVCVVPYVLVIMPVFGYVSSGIAWVLGQACMSDVLAVRVIVGYVAAALFLPLVACGMHHGMVALYAVQLQELGCVTLYPELAMAGAGQVGASLAIYVKARRLGHRRLRSVVGGALPAGVLGVGEPLVYGVTLPMGRPFVTAGLGAGFGGAFVAACRVASTAWGPSGLLGAFVMTAGEGGAVRSVAMYLVGIAISYVMGFLITAAAIKDRDVAQALGGVEGDPAQGEGAGGAPAPCARRAVRHGEPVALGSVRHVCFRHVVADPVGLHARPAGELARIASSYDARVTVRYGGREADASSVSELMLLDVPEAGELELSVSGKDARRAAESLGRFLDNNL